MVTEIIHTGADTQGSVEYLKIKELQCYPQKNVETKKEKKVAKKRVVFLKIILDMVDVFTGLGIRK